MSSLSVIITKNEAANRPHAVSSVAGSWNASFSYDANGNMTVDGDRTLTYTSFNLPATIVKNGKTTSLMYGADHERAKETHADGSVTRSLNPRLDSGAHYDQRTYLSGVVEKTSYLYAGNRPIGIYSMNANGVNGVNTLRYFHVDAQGSIVAITSGDTANVGAVVERLSYDAWGKRRNPNGTDDTTNNLKGATTDHGYTGHMHLDDVGLIHMNGRVYDPRLGRFLEADPYIQAPGNLQSYNRYSYVLNNPFMYTDPSGFSFWSKLDDKWNLSESAPIIVAAVASYFTYGAVSGSSWAMCTQAGATYGGIAAGAAAGAAGGAVMGATSGGTLDSTLKGAAYGGISGAIGGGISSYYGSTWSVARVAANSVGSGFSSAIQGGNFNDGFRTGFTMSGLTYLAVSMRAAMAYQSGLSPGNLNANGDLGGGRIVQETLDALVKENNGDVQKALEQYFKTVKGSPLGGIQGSSDHYLRVLGHKFHYANGSFVHAVVEKFAGPHDYFNSPIWYNDVGNALTYQNSIINFLAEGVNYTNVLLVAPIVGASAIPEYMYGTINMQR